MIWTAIVGRRGAAVVTGLQAWIGAGRGAPDTVYLLHTSGCDGTEGVAEKVKEHLVRSHGIADVRLERLDALFERTDEVDGWAAILAGEQGLVFHADPGAAFLVARLAARVGPGVTYVHADDTHLHVRNPDGIWEQAELPDLGLMSVLHLNGWAVTRCPVAPNVEDLWTHLGAGRPPDLCRPESSHPGLNGLDALWERRGRLYGLLRLDAGMSADARRVRLRSHARLKGPNRPAALAVVSPNEPDLRRARISDMLAIDARLLGPREADHERLAAWLAGAAGLVPPRRGSGFTPTKGTGGGDLGTLAVALSADPSATLVSLCTHRPRTALVFYDAGPRGTTALAGRLHAAAAQLPVGMLHLLPTTHIGQRIEDAVATAGSRDGALRVDGTPGTQAQTCALVRGKAHAVRGLPQRLGHSEKLDAGVWTTNLGAMQAESLAGDRVAVQVPPLLLQGSVVGGPIHDKGLELRRGPTHASRAVLRVLARHLAHCQDGGLDLRGALDDTFDRLQHARHPAKCCLGVRLERGHWVVQTCGQARAQCPNTDLNMGGWFEQLVAAAVADAGADEVRVNMKWGQHGDLIGEVDVAARFGTRFVVIECKTGQWHDAPVETAERAGTFLGRQALPFVAVLDTAPPQDEAATIITLQDLADPERLRAALVTGRPWAPSRAPDPDPTTRAAPGPAETP